MVLGYLVSLVRALLFIAILPCPSSIRVVYLPTADDGVFGVRALREIDEAW